jgi:hypothetical protein
VSANDERPEGGCLLPLSLLLASWVIIGAVVARHDAQQARQRQPVPGVYAPGPWP